MKRLRFNKEQFKSIQRSNQYYRKELLRKPTRAELIVKSFLEEYKIKYIFQKSFITPFPRIADFFIPVGDIIIEVDGSSHNKTVRLDWAKDNFWCNNRYMETIRITNDEVFSGSFKEKLLTKLFLTGVSL
jgi:very-short-patch-repair endonuclease